MIDLCREPVEASPSACCPHDEVDHPRLRMGVERVSEGRSGRSLREDVSGRGDI